MSNEMKEIIRELLVALRERGYSEYQRLVYIGDMKSKGVFK